MEFLLDTIFISVGFLFALLLVIFFWICIENVDNISDIPRLFIKFIICNWLTLVIPIVLIFLGLSAMKIGCANI